jgi:molecular chaperone Hsp33
MWTASGLAFAPGDDVEQEQRTDRITRALAMDGAVRLIWVDATGPARHAAEIHGLRGDGARVVAEGMVAAALLSAHVKGEDRIAFQIQGSEPEVALYADARGDGGLRARLTPDRLAAPGGRLVGFLLVIHSNADGEVYRGTTEVTGQTIAEALADHLLRSQQVDAGLRIEVELDASGLPRLAGGLLAERLPSRDEVSLDALFDDIWESTPGQLLAGPTLLGRPIEVLETRPLAWRCTCSREKVAQILGLLGRDELDDMIARDHGAEVTCHFCNQVYAFDEADLASLR